MWIPIVAGAALPAGGPEQVGNKAWNLARMAEAGLPVPPAFVLPTNWCRAVRDPATLRAALAEGIARLEAETGRGFGAARHPLLVSVRSGAAVSMPGMMETVLDLGLNEDSVQGLLRATGNPRLAWDCWRRLVQGFAEVVAGLPPAPFEELVAAALREDELAAPRELDHRALRRLTQAMLERYRSLVGGEFPRAPMAQLEAAAEAVFRSWDAPKAATYRALHGLDNLAGTAVTIQAMVFGNAGGASGSGVGFTRNPATGARELYLDFAFNGQGEDVVAGRETLGDSARLARVLPGVQARLEAIARTLEQLFGDAQDFEFTLQSGELFLLQTRRAKRTPWATLRIAVDLVEEGLIAPAEARARLAEIDLAALVRTRLAGGAAVLAEAVVAGIGVASGPIALDSAAAARMAQAGTPAILVRRDTVTEDIAGMADAAGILTATGGRTSHAAVVARQLGKVCLVACAALSIDLAARRCRIGGQEFVEGEEIALDGNEGRVYPGRLAVVSERPDRELAAVARWG